MVIVTGHLLVDPAARWSYLVGCEEVVRAGRSARGCLDFALSPDLLDPGRINILELWQSQTDVEAFRGSGTFEDQSAAIRAADVAEYDVTAKRRLD